MTTKQKAAECADTQTAYETVRTGQAKHTTRRADPVSFILPIDDRYRLTADERCWRIEQRRKGGEWRPIEYHSTLEAAVTSLGGRLLRTSEVQTLADRLGRGGKRLTHAHAGAGTALQAGGAVMNERENIRAALGHIPAYDRELWLRIGMAIKSELGEEGFDLWDGWSQRDESYNERDRTGRVEVHKT